jgi:hypothetical protein
MRQLISGLVLLLSTTASAHDLGTYQWVGQTKTPLAGTAGFLTLTTQCRTDFGPGARMCTGAEIQGSSTLEVDGIAEAGCWVRPETLSVVGASLDRTGLVLSGGGGPDCGQWTAGGRGLVFGHDGRFSVELRDEERPVACCMPVSAPKPPACRGSQCRPR